MKKVVRLNENDLTNIVKRVLSEQQTNMTVPNQKTGMNVPKQTTGGGTVPNVKKITPVINIDCNRRVILNSQLPKLDKTANYTIINHYCNK